MKKLNVLLRSLIAQFFLGMAVNVIGKPTPDMSALARYSAYILLALHVLNAVFLVVVAGLLYKEFRGNPAWQKSVTRGLWLIVIAFVAGSLTVGTPLEGLFSFVMAGAFILAFINYGTLYFQQRNQVKA